MKILVLNGPNLGRLGIREPEIYGSEPLTEIDAILKEMLPAGVSLETRQTDDEAEMIHWLHEAYDEKCAVILNPGAFTHYSYAIRDAAVQLKSNGTALIEVHISNPYSRERFRHTSVLSEIATGFLGGFGIDSYRLALIKLLWDAKL